MRKGGERQRGGDEAGQQPEFVAVEAERRPAPQPVLLGRGHITEELGAEARDVARSTRTELARVGQIRLPVDEDHDRRQECADRQRTDRAPHAAGIEEREHDGDEREHHAEERAVVDARHDLEAEERARDRTEPQRAGLVDPVHAP